MNDKDCLILVRVARLRVGPDTCGALMEVLEDTAFAKHLPIERTR